MQKGFYIASQILRRPWAIDFRFAEAHKHIPNMLLSGLAFDTQENLKQDKRTIPYVISDARKPYTQSFIDFSEAPENSIAVIPIIGPLMKYDVEDCGMITIGMGSLGRIIQDAVDNPNISAIILYMDTPGGTVDGTQSLAHIIEKANQQKPVITFVDGLMASAGTWLGSKSGYIIAENTTTEIGSIGVCYSFFDNLKQLEAEGTTFHYIVPEESADKNAPFMAALKGEYDLIIESELRPLVNMFRDEVRKGRGEVENSAMTGKVFFAEEALSLNLIDEIGSFQRAVEKASELAQTQTKSSKTQTKKKMKTLTRLAAIFGIEAFEINDEADAVDITIEQMEAAELSLEQLHASLDQANADLGTANDDLGTATQTISTLNQDAETAQARIRALEAEVEQHQARIAELEEDPELKIVPKDGDDNPQEETASKDPGAARMKKKFQAISGAK